MIGGHYTACARLPNDRSSQRSDVGEARGRRTGGGGGGGGGLLTLCPLHTPPAAGWRLFDDSTVTTVDESQVVTRYAYVLFYRRRNSPVERPPRAGHAERHPDLGPAAEAAASQVRPGRLAR